MNANLTLTMDNSVITSIEDYAANSNLDISLLVENFFRQLLSAKKKNVRISPLVQELSGIIPLTSSDEEDYLNYLESKYV